MIAVERWAGGGRETIVSFGVALRVTWYNFADFTEGSVRAGSIISSQCEIEDTVTYSTTITFRRSVATDFLWTFLRILLRKCTGVHLRILKRLYICTSDFRTSSENVDSCLQASFRQRNNSTRLQNRHL